MIKNNEQIILLDKTVKIRLNGKNKEWYINKGYKWTKSGDEIEVNIYDLSPKAETIIKAKCPYCNKEHYTMWKSVYLTHNTVCHDCDERKPNIQKCQFCGELTNRTYNGNGICNRHRYQIRQYGKIIIGRYDNNNIIIDEENNIAKIELSYKNNEIYYAIIDLEDLDKIKQYFWHIEKFNDNLFYVASSRDEKTLRLHSLIMNTPKGFVVDHINHNGLDNRKENLRICTVQENSMNCLIRRGSLYIDVVGVTFDKKRGYWKSYITYKGKTYNLGEFKKVENAVYCRYYAETILFQDFKCEEHKELYKEYIEKCKIKDKIKQDVQESIQQNKIVLDKDN